MSMVDWFLGLPPMAQAIVAAAACVSCAWVLGRML